MTQYNIAAIHKQTGQRLIMTVRSKATREQLVQEINKLNGRITFKYDFLMRAPMPNASKFHYILTTGQEVYDE